MEETSPGCLKIIRSSHVRKNPQTSDPWEHGDAHIFTRRDMNKNSGKTALYRTKVGLFQT